MKNIFIIIGLLFSLGFLQAQTIVPSTINAGSGSLPLNTNNISFVIAEYAVLNIQDSTVIVSNGFLPTVTLTALEQPNKDILELIIYPNPSDGLINIQITKAALSNLTVHIYGVDGKMYYSDTFVDFNRILNLDISGLSSGIYLLNLMDEKGKRLAHYRIVKK